MGTQTYSRTYTTDTAIDGTVQATTTIETTITEGGVDRRFQVLIARAITSEADNVLTGPVISIGTNSPNYNNIVSSQSVGGALGILDNLTLASSLEEIPEGTGIKCKVVTAATALPLHSVTHSFKLALFGIDQLYSE